MATLIITEKTSQAKDLAAALGSRYGKILPAEGHLLRLAEPDEIDPAWKRWSCTLLKPDGLYPTRSATGGNKSAKLKAIEAALKLARRASVPAVPLAVKTNFWGNGVRFKEFGPITPAAS